MAARFSISTRLSSVAFALLLTVGADVYGADDEDLFQLNLDDLLQIDLSTSIATRLPLSQRRNPAILSIITADDIRAMGARDLIDVIQRIPGFPAGCSISLSHDSLKFAN